MEDSEPPAKRRKVIPRAGNTRADRAHARARARAQLDNSTLPVYTYGALKEEDEIRLFKVEKIGPSEWQYDIEHTTLTDAPPFETVSYVWGSDARQNILRLRGSRMIRINDNLAQAIPYLSAECKTGYLWIDQININQSSTQERNHQVKMMGDIYKKGERVIAWLGTGPNPSKKLLALIEVARPFNFKGVSSDRKLIREKVEGHLLELCVNEFAAILQLLKSTWFSRAWVFQEVVLSKQATFLFGDTTIPFEAMFLIGRQSAIYKAENNDDSGFGTTSTRGYHTLDVLQRSWIAASNGLGENCTSFVSQLSRTSSILETTDSRDSVYAFLGLQSWDQDAVPIQADYESTYEETLINTAKSIISNMRSLEILSHCERKRDTHLSKRLPSWVPEWRMPLSAPLHMPDQRYSERSASYGQHLLIQTANSEELHARGISFDTIDTCLTPEFRLQATRLYDENLEEYLALDKRQKLVQNHTACSRERLLKVFMDSSCWSVDNPNAYISAISDAKIRDFLKAYDKYIGTLDNTQAVTGSQDMYTLMLRENTCRLNTRQLFVTKGGHLGYVRQPCKGDVICTLRGFPGLITLRPCENNRFTVVGTCYAEEILWNIDQSTLRLYDYLRSLWEKQAGEDFILV